MGITGDSDRRISRRTLLRGGRSLAAGLALGGALGRRAFGADPRFQTNPFTLGVASGDPSPDGVVLWTRPAPDPLVPGGGMTPRPHVVRFELALDDRFRRIVRRGTTVAWARGGTQRSGRALPLVAGRRVLLPLQGRGGDQPVGRIRTAPPAGVRVAQMRFAFAG